MILDTHAWIFYLTRKPLSKASLRKIQSSSIGIASVTLWEAALLIQTDRIRIQGSMKDWLNTAIARSRVRVDALDADIAQESVRLTPILRDPADCQIVGTALVRSVPLVTRDARMIEASGHLGLTIIEA
ncbi:MAG TPA: type II toxin-antitoxin system VapC family toxin [Polyangiaceae bacterium]|nr:type II toxin-antitoxin system VapC family toxin [Polyangiaceae bacterium]